MINLERNVFKNNAKRKEYCGDGVDVIRTFHTFRESFALPLCSLQMHKNQNKQTQKNRHNVNNEIENNPISTTLKFDPKYPLFNGLERQTTFS